VAGNGIDFGEKSFLNITFKNFRLDPKDEFNFDLASSMMKSKVMQMKIDDPDKDLNDSIEI